MGGVIGGLGFLLPLDGGYRLDDVHQREHDRRQAALQSVESTLSTIDYPHTPSKLYTEPARVHDTAQFNVQSLDFLNDTPASETFPSTWRIHEYAVNLIVAVNGVAAAIACMGDSAQLQ